LKKNKPDIKDTGISQSENLRQPFYF